VSTAGEVLYEVTLDVEAGIEAEYHAWLRDHVAQMLALPGFVDARTAEVVEPAPAPGRVVFCVHPAARHGGVAGRLRPPCRRHAGRRRGPFR
jgi:hypothetical protein